MLTIYKYPIDSDKGDFVTLKGATVLSAGFQHGTLMVWVLVNTAEAEIEKRNVRVYGTGPRIEPNVQRRFLNTIHFNGLVFHAFEETLT